MTVLASDVIGWLRECEEEDYDAIYELRYATENEAYSIPTVPSDYKVRVLKTATDIYYDSYGNGYNGDAYIILEITDPNGAANFKLSGEYASYEGWSWKIGDVIQVAQTPKVTTVMEWTAI